MEIRILTGPKRPSDKMFSFIIFQAGEYEKCKFPVESEKSLRIIQSKRNKILSKKENFATKTKKYVNLLNLLIFRC